jgi:hypothetical protein
VAPTRKSRSAGAFPQLLLGLGEADIHSGLAVAGAGNQKLEGNGGLARAWTSLKQVQPIASPAAFENRVEADNVIVRAW